MTDTLFDVDDDAPAHEPPAPRPGKVKPAPKPLPPGFDEPHTRDGPYPRCVALAVAADLTDLLTEYHAGKVTADELYRYVRGSVYLLDGAGLVALAERIGTLLRE